MAGGNMNIRAAIFFGGGSGVGGVRGGKVAGGICHILYKTHCHDLFYRTI